MKYGQHESFHLRLNWLRKGIKAIKNNPQFFQNKSAAEVIGIGKNMVSSLKFWMTTFGIIKESDSQLFKGYFELSSFGRLIEVYDPYLENKNTLALLHFNLVNKEYKGDVLIVWDYIFNCFSGQSITKELLLNEISTFVHANGYKFSEKSILKDIECLIRLYVTEEETTDPEDIMFSPLSKLGLISASGNRGIFHKNVLKAEQVGDISLYYILLKYAQHNQIDNLSVDEIENKENLWGKLFNLSRTEIVNALDRLSKRVKNPIVFQKNNRIYSVVLPSLNVENFLVEEFAREGVSK
jgi:hypothetical protein